MKHSGGNEGGSQGAMDETQGGNEGCFRGNASPRVRRQIEGLGGGEQQLEQQLVRVMINKEEQQYTQSKTHKEGCQNKADT